MKRPTGSLWLHLKEFLPNQEIKYDVYLKTEEKWVLLWEDFIIKEHVDMYTMLLKKHDDKN